MTHPPQSGHPPKLPWPAMSPPTSEDPTELGPYQVHGRLGAGDLGVVYGAADPAGLWAAVKVLGPEYAARVARGGFERALEPASRLRARGIAPIIAYDTQGPGVWYATPHVSGPTLEQHVTSQGPVNPDLLRALAVATAEALSVLHAAGVVHHDLKPSNVVLAPDGPKLLDFAVAPVVGAGPITPTGELRGSPAWHSPESFHSPAGPRADVFAWGALLVYAATGRSAFGSGHAEGVMYRMLREDPDLTGLPPELVDPVRAALAKQPTARPGAAELTRWLLWGSPAQTPRDTDAAVAELLQRSWRALPPPPPPEPAVPPPADASGTPAAGGYPPAAIPPKPATPSSFVTAGDQRPRRRRPALLPMAAAAVALVVLVGIGGFFLLRGNGSLAEEGNGQSVTIGLIPWDEGIAVTRLWEAILTERGYDVAVEDVDVEQLFGGLADGDYDVFLDAWLPDTHADYWTEHGDRLEDIGAWYEGATLHLTVPAYVDEVDSIADLPANADLFDGRIVGIEAESGLAGLVEDEVIPAYDLTGYDHLASSTSAMGIELDAAIVARDPIVVTLWRPHLAYSQHALKDLEDPEGALGTGEQLHAITRQRFADDHPEVHDWLADFELSPTELEELMGFVHLENSADPAEGARAWLRENPEFLERTLGDDAAGLTF